MFQYRKVFIPVLLLLGGIALVISCSGGSGSPERASAPGEENVPARVLVSSDRTVVDVVTGDNTVTLIAEVLNEQGRWMRDVLVTFHTSFGVLNHEGPDAAVPTDRDGIARATLSASSEGMAIVEINAGDVADYTLIRFVDFTTAEQQRNYRVLLTAEPTSLPGDGATPATLTAYVVDGNNQPVQGITVTFYADDPDASFNMPIYTGGAGGGEEAPAVRSSAPESARPAFQTDDDIMYYISFSATTDAAGQAQVLLYPPWTVYAHSIILRAEVYIPPEWVVNEPPQWYWGEYVTVYSIDSISINAPELGHILLERAESVDEWLVPPYGTSLVRARVMDSNGFPMPDDTVVNFSVVNPNMGWVESFAYTLGGAAGATYYADAAQTGPVTISARANGITTQREVFYVSTLDPTIEPLGLAPEEATIIGSGDQATFAIINGIPPFDFSTDLPQYLDLTLSDSTITAVGRDVPRERMTATLTVRDATYPEREAAEASIILGEVDTEAELSLSPASVTLTREGQSFVFGINNGIPPYGVSTDQPSLIDFTLGHNHTVEVRVLYLPTGTNTATLFVRDATARTPAQATITLEGPEPITGELTITPPSQTATFDSITCRSCPWAGGPYSEPWPLQFIASGGTGSYTWSVPVSFLIFDDGNGQFDCTDIVRATTSSTSGVPVTVFPNPANENSLEAFITVTDTEGRTGTASVIIPSHTNSPPCP